MAIAPWATSIELWWPQSLRFYQRRWEMLADIESLIGLRAFEADGDLVTARLDTPGWAEVTLRPGSLGLHRRLPEGEWDELLLAARLVTGALEPKQPPRARVFTQFLLDLGTEEYDEARTTTGGRITGTWTSRIGLTDWALLFDGSRGTVDYQVEAGVVSRVEVPQRLGRFAGRIAGPRFDLNGLLQELQPEDVPSVAFFADFATTDIELMADEDWTEQCIDAVDLSTVIVAEIFKAVTGGADYVSASAAI